MATAGRRKRKVAKTAEPNPAPGDLAIIQALVNTASPGGGSDALATPQELGRWLSRRRLLDAGIELDEAQRRRAVDLRAGLRALIVGGSSDADALSLRRLEPAVGRARFELRFDDDGRPAGFAAASGGFDDALGALVQIALWARLEGRWPRLKLCARGDCRQAFFDAAPGRSGKWCTPRCGYRVRAAAYRRSGKSHKFSW